MNTLARLESTLEWWDETELPRLRVAVAADPTNRDSAAELERAGGYRERAYTKASNAFDRQWEAEYARQGASMWDETSVFDTMSGGTIVR